MSLHSSSLILMLALRAAVVGDPGIRFKRSTNVPLGLGAALEGGNSVECLVNLCRVVLILNAGDS